MNAILTEPAVIEMMRAEQVRIEAQAEELWTRLKAAEESMKPYKEAYDKVLWEWSEAHRLSDSLKAILAAKTPTEAQQICAAVQEAQAA